MDRVVLITGGGRGIGQATARLAAARGWSVAVNYVSDPEAATNTADRINNDGGRAIAIRADVAVEADVIALFDATERTLGPLRGVVNNAGIVTRAGSLADREVSQMRRVIDVNVLGALLVAREAARRMPLSRGGHGGAIVNVSSIAAKLGGAFEYVDYAATKGALDTLTIGLAKEMAGEGVRVNAVRPGLIETEIHASSGRPDRAAALGARTPIGRAGTAEEAAEAILWLLDDAASYVTGALLDVSGGR